MQNIQEINKIKIEDFNYNLPEDRIAKYPLTDRDLSKLLVYKNGSISDDYFTNISKYIPEKSLLVFNNTKVIQARLIFYKTTGARIEIFCLEPLNPADFVINFQQNKTCTWKCIIGNLKKWKDFIIQKSISLNDTSFILTAEKIADHQSYQEIKFSWNNPEITFSEILFMIGETPLPPYLNRDSEELDKIRYQTIYSKINGSVAAPTAGLHFTKTVLESIHAEGHKTEELTLHVGAGTFKPVKSEFIADHEMHTEHFFVSEELINNLITNSDNIIAVGTTSLRTLESLYWLGVQLIQNKHNFHVSQWEPYENSINISAKESLAAILNYLNQKNIKSLSASTQIMIVPGYEFKIIKGIITNFHQPQSTLLLLITALIGDNWKVVYEYAMKNNFRFLSYGDSSLLLK